MADILRTDVGYREYMIIAYQVYTENMVHHQHGGSRAERLKGTKPYLGASREQKGGSQLGASAECRKVRTQSRFRFGQNRRGYGTEALGRRSLGRPTLDALCRNGLRLHEEGVR